MNENMWAEWDGTFWSTSIVLPTAARERKEFFVSTVTRFPYKHENLTSNHMNKPGWLRFNTDSYYSRPKDPIQRWLNTGAQLFVFFLSPLSILFSSLSFFSFYEFMTHNQKGILKCQRCPKALHCCRYGYLVPYISYGMSCVVPRCCASGGAYVISWSIWLVDFQETQWATMVWNTTQMSLVFLFLFETGTLVPYFTCWFLSGLDSPPLSHYVSRHLQIQA